MEEAERSADDSVVDGLVGRNCGVFSLVLLLCLCCLRRTRVGKVEGSTVRNRPRLDSPCQS